MDTHTALVSICQIINALNLLKERKMPLEFQHLNNLRLCEYGIFFLLKLI